MIQLVGVDKGALHNIWGSSKLPAYIYISNQSQGQVRQKFKKQVAKLLRKIRKHSFSVQFSLLAKQGKSKEKNK